MRAIIVALFVSVLCLGQSARAEEVIGPDDVSAAVAADTSPVEAPEIETDLANGVIVLGVPWWWESVSTSAINLLGVGLKFILVYAVGWLLRKFMSDERAKKVQDALAVGVDHAWEDMGRQLKHDAKDRKLNADERQKLRNKAIEHAKKIGAAGVRALIESYSVSTVEAKIAGIVEKRKAISSMGKTNAVSKIAA